MKKNTIITILITFLIGAFAGYYFGYDKSIAVADNQDKNLSSYVGQETRTIKSLSEDDIEALLEGSGVVFGGMAKPAELNGYPGPKHILELSDGLGLTTDQKSSIKILFDEMQTKSVKLGNELIEKEIEIDVQFASKTISKTSLQKLLSNSASLYGELRNTHLQAHLMTIDILSQEQVNLYNQLRGYDSDDPCSSVPEGHDPVMWRLHNNCEEE